MFTLVSNPAEKGEFMTKDNINSKDKTEALIEELIQELKKYDSLEDYPKDKEEELGKIRDKLISIGKPSVPYLIEVLNNHDSWSCYFAAEALGKMKDKSAIEPLIDAFDELDLGEEVRKSLKIIGPSCIPYVIKHLEKRIKERNKTNSHFITNALSTIGEIKCDDSINFLNTLLDDYVSKMPDEDFDIDTYDWEYQGLDFFHLLDCMVRQQDKRALPYIKRARDRFPKNYTDYKVCQIAMGRIKKGKVEGYLPMEAMEIAMPFGALMNAFSGGKMGWKDTFDENYGEYFEDEDENDEGDEDV